MEEDPIDVDDEEDTRKVSLFPHESAAANKSTSGPAAGASSSNTSSSVIDLFSDGEEANNVQVDNSELRFPHSLLAHSKYRKNSTTCPCQQCHCPICEKRLTGQKMCCCLICSKSAEECVHYEKHSKLLFTKSEVELDSINKQMKDCDCNRAPYQHGIDNITSAAMTTIVKLEHPFDTFPMHLMPSQKQTIQFMLNLEAKPLHLKDICKPDKYDCISKYDPLTWPLFTIGMINLGTGMGKTPAVICDISFRKQAGLSYKTIIFCGDPLLLSTWQKACTDWGLKTPSEVLYRQNRERYYDQHSGDDIDVWITSPFSKLNEKFMKLFDRVIIDEAHELYKGKSNDLMANIRGDLFRNKFVWLITATPYYTGDIKLFFKFLMELYYGTISKDNCSKFAYMSQVARKRSNMNEHTAFDTRATIMKKYMLVQPKYIHLRHNDGSFAPNFKLPNTKYIMSVYDLDEMERSVYNFCERVSTHMSELCLVHDYKTMLTELTYQTHAVFSQAEQIMELQRLVDMIQHLSDREVSDRPLFQVLVKTIRDILESSADSRIVVICSSPAFQTFFDYCNSHSDSFFECLVVRDTPKANERYENSKMLCDFNSSITYRVICVPTTISRIGVNLQLATHLLIPEPIWVLNDFEQTLGRLERPFGVTSDVEITVFTPNATILDNHYKNWRQNISNSRTWTYARPSDISDPIYPLSPILQNLYRYLPFHPCPGRDRSFLKRHAKSSVELEHYVLKQIPPTIRKLKIICMFEDGHRSYVTFNWSLGSTISIYYTEEKLPIIAIDCRNPDSVIAYDICNNVIDIPFVQFKMSYTKHFMDCEIVKGLAGRIQRTNASLHGSKDSKLSLEWSLDSSQSSWPVFFFGNFELNTTQNFSFAHGTSTALLLLFIPQIVLDDNDSSDQKIPIINHNAFTPNATLKYARELPFYIPTTHFRSLAFGLYIECGFDMNILQVQTEVWTYEGPSSTRPTKIYNILSPKGCHLVPSHGDCFCRIQHCPMNSKLSQGIYKWDDTIYHSVRSIPVVLPYNIVRMSMRRDTFGAHSFCCDKRQSVSTDLSVRTVRRKMPQLNSNGPTIYITFSDRDRQQDSAARDLITLASTGEGSSSNDSV